MTFEYTQYVSALVFSALTGCSLWVDEFSCADDYNPDAGETDTSTSDTDTDADSDADMDTDSDTDTDTDSNTGVETSCGISVTPPLGQDIEFCELETGSFFMGCDDTMAAGESCTADETPVHEVTVSAFLLQRYEVTNAEYAVFVTDRPQWAPGGTSAVGNCNYAYLADWLGGEPPLDHEQHPVVGVCWHAARAFCQWLGGGFDLPTEAQWEYAARGDHDGHGSSTYWIYPFGNSTSCALANYESCIGDLQEVGISVGASQFGILDMAGNAWEWTLDFYRSDFYCDPEGTGLYSFPNCDTAYDWSDPICDESQAVRTVRGGSWYHPTSMLRNAKRTGLEPSTSSNLIGLRCAR